MEKLEKQPCPFCHKKTLVMVEEETDIPYFGKVFIFSASCDNSECNYKVSDVEAAELKDPVKITFTIENKKDLNVRVVKSSSATVKVPQMKMDVRPGPAAEGYVSNVEGILNRFEKIIEYQRDTAEDDSVKKSAKNLLKKMRKVKWGDIPLKIVIEDPSGNSAIISDKAVVEKLKGKK
ncbi:MAG: ZPR1 zinc finger domain-containing protein [Nanoarchaeota archaeon]|nr:ZPR1 zinc finger domain-containing protein [Nanoarchaeota archaeon]